MTLRKAAPEEGGEQAREQFAYLNTPAGLKHAWTGWLACDPYWFIGHEHKKHTPGTQPCLNWITSGAVRCVRCGKGAEKKKMCYCHIYREFDGKPLLVIVQEAVKEVMKGLAFRSHVLVGRLDDQASSFVKPTDTNLPFRPENERRKNPIDTAVSLLGIWKIPELTEWYERGRWTKPTITQEQLPTGNWRLSVPPATTEVEALALDAHRRQSELDGAGVDDALQRALKRTKEAERNGKHKPPE